MGPDYPNRRAKLLRRLKKIEVDGLIISNPANVRYLTGFTGRLCLVISQFDKLCHTE